MSRKTRVDSKEMLPGPRGLARRGDGPVSDRLIARLSLCRRRLNEHPPASAALFSHELAVLCGSSAAQVRRDLMTIGFGGNPAHGYRVRPLVEAIGRFLDVPEGQTAALAGVGNLGRAVLEYMAVRQPHLRIVAAFDIDRAKVNRVLDGCRIWPLRELHRVIRRRGIQVGVITAPTEAAQAIAEQMLAAGVRGFVNFSARPLRLPAGTYVEEMDIAASIERVAYFARRLTVQEWGETPSS